MSSTPARLFLSLAIASASQVDAHEIEMRGRLLAHDGRPLPGAEVRLHRRHSEAESAHLLLAGLFRPEAVAAVASADDGRFRLVAPGPDMWELAVRHEEHMDVVREMLPLVESRDLGDVELPRRHFQPILLVDASGRPVAGFHLAATSLSNTWSREGWRLETRRVETGEDGRAAIPRLAGEGLLVGGLRDGRFLLERLEPSSGPARLVVRDRLREARVTDMDGRPLSGVAGLLMVNIAFGPSGDHGALEIPVVPMRRIASGRGVSAGPMPLFLADESGVHLGHVSPVETDGGLVLRLPETRVVTGRVIDDATDEGIAGALVSTNAAFASSGRGGAFTARLRPSPDPWLLVKAAGYLEASVHGPRLDPDPGEEVRIRIRKASSLSGRVVDAAGIGIPRAKIRLRADRRHLGLDLTSLFFYQEDEFVADDGGSFRLTGLTDSVPYLVRVSATGHASREVVVPPLERGPPAAPLEISLEPGRTAFGTVLDAGGQPAAGGRVTLYPAPLSGLDVHLGAGEGEVFEAVAGAEGRFEIADLGPGIFRLRVGAPGHAPLDVPGVEIGDQPTVDLGTLRLETGAKLEGRVVDSGGRPLTGALLNLYDPSLEPLPGAASPSTYTDSEGSFRFSDLPKGVSVSLSVSAQGYATASLDGLSVERGEPLVVVLERGSSLRGRVVDAAGRPAVARVALSRVSGYSSSTTANGTDPDGRFEFPDLAPGRATLSATSGEGVARPLVLDLEPGESRDVELVLRPAAKVRGTLLGPGGDAVAGARVRLERHRPGEVDRMAPVTEALEPSFATSDDEGRFALSGIAQGAYRLQAEHPEFGSVDQLLELAEGAVREVLLRFVDRCDLSVEGQVVNERGAGVEGAVVRLVDGRRRAVESATAHDGHFELRAPRPGVYSLLAESPDRAAGRSETFEVTAGGVRGLVLELEAGATVSGRVRGADDQDLARLRVTAYSRDALVSRQGVVDREGRYRIPHLAPGEWMVSAVIAATDRWANGRAVVGPAGDVVHLDLEFAEASRLAGRVLLDGRPLTAGSARAFCGQTASGSHQLGPDGRFEIAGAPHGDCTLRVTAAGRAVAGAFEVTVPDGSDLTLELESGTLSGTVASAADRRPIPGASISARPGDRSFRVLGPGRNASETVESDAAGRFAFAAITPGRWVIEVTLDGYAAEERELELTGLADEVEILLRPTAPAVLLVRSEDGSVPPQVQVTGLDERGHGTWSQLYRPDGEGRVVLRRLAPGVHRLRVSGTDGESVDLEIAVPGEPMPVLLAR